MSTGAPGSGFHMTATDTIPAPGGILHTVTINTGASGGTFDIRDGASGNTIASIDASSPRTFIYDLVLTNGVHAAVSGAIDVTVVILPPGSSA